MSHTHTINHDHSAFTSGGMSGNSTGSMVGIATSSGYSASGAFSGSAKGSSANTWGTSSGNRSTLSMNIAHTHSIDVPSYSGSSGGASNSTTSDGGFSNTAFSVMPAYEIAYCWKRTA